MKKIFGKEKSEASNTRTLPFDCAETLLRLCRTSLLIELNLSFDFSEMPSPQR